MFQLFTAIKASQALFFPLLEQLLPQTIQSILFGRLLRCSKAEELKWTESHAVIFFVLGEREKKKTPNPNRWRDILTELHCINSATCLPEQCPLTTSGNVINQQPSVEQQGTALHGQHKQIQPTADQGILSGDRTGTAAPCHQPAQLTQLEQPCLPAVCAYVLHLNRKRWWLPARWSYPCWKQRPDVLHKQDVCALKVRSTTFPGSFVWGLI